MTARVAFSPDLPFVVTARGFVYRGRVYGRGEVFPWRELGIDEQEVLQLWMMLKLDCLLPAQDAHAAAPTAPPAIERPQKKRYQVRR